MNFGFFTDPDRTRFAYLRLRRLRAALKDEATLAAAAHELAVPSDEMAAPSPRAKLAALERHIDRLRRTAGAPWSDVPAPEILAAAIFRAGLGAPGPSRDLFSPAAHERDVAKAARSWLESAGFALFEDLPRGLPVDAVGYQKGLLSGVRVVGVAIKNDVASLEAALVGLPSLARYLSSAYVACTPALAAAYLSARAAASTPPRWDPQAFDRRLGAAGVGLLVVEGDAIAEVKLPKHRALDLKAIEDVMAALRQRPPG